MEVIFWAVLTILFWGAAPVLEKAALAKANPFVAVTVRTIAISIIVFIGALFTGQFSKMMEIDGKTIFLIILGGLFAGLFGQITYFFALKQAEASRVVPLVMAFPLVTAILGIWFLNESITLQKVTGAVFFWLVSALLVM